MEFIIKSQLSGKNRDSDRLSGFERIILQIAINQACHPASRILFIDEKLADAELQKLSELFEE